MDDSKAILPVITPWAQWLRAYGLGPLVAAWFVPAHPLVLLGRNALYVAEPLFGAAAARLGQELENPTTLQAWRLALGAADPEGVA